MIIGIGGASRSGKSELAKLLNNALGEKKVIILNQDDYAFSILEIPQINEVTDWETPKSIDFHLLRADIDIAKTHHDIVVVEGFLAYHSAELNTNYDKSLFVEIDKSIFVQRRLVDDRWGEEPNWYIEHVWDSYLEYGQLPKDHNALVIDGNKSMSEIQILEYLNLNK